MKLTLFTFILLSIICGCGIGHRHEDIIIADMNGYFKGYIRIDELMTGDSSETIIEAALVQTQDEIYGTITGVFDGVPREILINGSVSGYTLSIEIKNIIGPVVLTGTVNERNVTIIGTYPKDDKTLSIEMFLESKNISPIIHESF